MSIELTYESLGRDGLSEIFERGLALVRENIDDPNTDAKKARKLTVEVTMKPNEQRNFIEISYAVKEALAPVKPVTITAMVDGDTLQIPENGTRPDQYELPVNVSPFEAKKEQANA